jgi:sugar phosphate isomerase/epimerase
MPERTPVLYPTWFLPKATPLECLLSVADAGFDGASYLVGTVDDPRRLDRLSEADSHSLTAALLRLGADRSLHVASDMYLSENADDGAALRAMKGHVAAAVAAVSADVLPPVTLTLDPPVRWDGGRPRFLREMALALLRFMASLAERCPVRAAIENWPFPFLGTPEVLTDTLDAADADVGILLDTGHAHIALTQGWCRQKTMREYVAALPGAVVEMHCHDNRGGKDEHLPPGEGTADIAAALAALKGRGFGGPVTLECDLSAPGRPGLAAGLAAFRESYLAGESADGRV